MASIHEYLIVNTEEYSGNNKSMVVTYSSLMCACMATLVNIVTNFLSELISLLS